MIRINIPGFYDFDGGGPRWGDCQIVDDGKFVDIIDGYCGTGATRLIERLKARDMRSVYLHISHAHYDHYNGIERIIEDDFFKVNALYCYDPKTLNEKFSDECANNVKALKRIISKAENRGIEVIFLRNGDKIIHGDIEIEVYRNQPETAENTDAYINNGSLCYWFPKLRYLTTGDAGLECAVENDLHPVLVKGGHHGNDFIYKVAKVLYDNGCRFYWDNDYSTALNDFLWTGRRHAINLGMGVMGVHGDINITAYNGVVTMYKGGEVRTYDCDYNGASPLKHANLAIVKSVLKGTLGKGDARITNLLDLGYYPTSVQNQVNELYKLIKG